MACCYAPLPLKRAAANAGINPKLSAHWLRHAHASHAIDRGAALPVVQSTLGHGNIAVTSCYLRARPGTSSGLSLEPGVFLPARSVRMGEVLAGLARLVRTARHPAVSPSRIEQHGEKR